MLRSCLERGSHSLGHEPYRQTTIIPHYLYWEYLTIRLICSKKGEKWVRVPSNHMLSILSPSPDVNLIMGI